MWYGSRGGGGQKNYAIRIGELFVKYRLVDIAWYIYIKEYLRVGRAMETLSEVVILFNGLRLYGEERSL